MVRVIESRFAIDAEVVYSETIGLSFRSPSSPPPSSLFRFVV
jgi:hypothetical protein